MGWAGSSKGKKAGAGKGKGSSGKGGGQWAWIPAVKTTFNSWGKSWGKKGGKSKGKGKGKKVTPFSELSDERKEEIRQKHEEKRSEQGREPAGNAFHFGELVSRRQRYGWIKPSNFAKLPANVQKKLKEMVKEKKAKASEHNADTSIFSQNVLFLHMSDVEEGVKVNVGDKVKFKVYVDTEGVGAAEVTTA
eukprot:TRINITY_DN833_c0_g1_i2.p1 TRINITY_DN833_c0_g1~~TRINITY_DN833_c0_g1_i2.p1  ORF type:complete len:191 (-),score=66.21 TRINITY_DN833_c0_g1_i2:131-703(-)